jgi:hypothetical protein
MLREGITIAKRGIGDALQCSSLPENYFKTKGEKLIDVDKCWIFDFNPFVSRETNIIPTKITQLWNFPHQWDWPNPRFTVPQKGDRNLVRQPPAVYLSNAEIWASLFNVPVILNRPRLYRFEDFPFKDRNKILLQTTGRSHGELPSHVIKHVINKYKDCSLYHIGAGDNYYGLEHIETPEIWDLIEEVSKAKMVIGPDSSIPWIATCYSDIIVKVVRTRPLPNVLEKWIPLEISNIHAHWDSRERMVYNPTENDVGFSWSYKRI